jgi:hypothetical protein
MDFNGNVTKSLICIIQPTRRRTDQVFGGRDLVSFQRTPGKMHPTVEGCYGSPAYAVASFKETVVIHYTCLAVATCFVNMRETSLKVENSKSLIW